MDPVSRQERHEENGMIQFYVNQLTDANNTIASLCAEVNKLLSGNQSKTNKVQERLMEQRLENQGLKSQIELLKNKIKLMQMRIEMNTPKLNPSFVNTHPGTHQQFSPVPGDFFHEHRSWIVACYLFLLCMHT
jgi:5-methylcytosine-specific restriction endonuclease McrBC regulatory subunit McrC